jgi:CheY-like chemotaxis protein
LVDDSVEFVQVLKEQAESWGMRPSVAYYGDQALQMMREAAAAGDPFVLASLDMNMPGLTGMQVALAMQQDPALAGIRRILLTAVREVPDKHRLSEAGVPMAIQKPASSRALKEAFLNLLGERLPDANSRHAQAMPDQIHGCRILVAEDNSVNQMVIRNMLKKLGTECDVAANGAEAVNLFSQASTPYDMILMDCEMPEMDGYDATRVIRTLEQEQNRPPTPIVALTAHAMKEHQDRCFAVGMNGHLSKPIEMRTLRDKLVEFLGKPASDNDTIVVVAASQNG